MYLYRNSLKNLNALEVMIATTGENAQIERTVAITWGDPKQQPHAPELEITSKTLKMQSIRTPAGQHESAHENISLDVLNCKSRIRVGQCRRDED